MRLPNRLCGIQLSSYSGPILSVSAFWELR